MRVNDNLPQSLIKKEIPFNMSGVSTTFAASQALFSSYDIDVGTRTLLNSLRKNKNIDYTKILDLGCGYGVIGIFLKKQRPDSIVTLSDRDALATRFSKYNAKLNGVDVECVAGVDYEQIVDNDYTLIITNYPAKMEQQGLIGFIAGASRRLVSGGTLAMVIVNELLADFDSVQALFKDKMVCTYRETKKGHTNIHLQFTQPLMDEIDYGRCELELANNITVKTVRGLPEFDTLGFDTLCALELIKSKSPRSVYILEPGQGHIAVKLSVDGKIDNIALASRDALSLKISEKNLKQYCTAEVTTNLVPYIESIPSDNDLADNDLAIWHLVGDNNLVVHKVNLKSFVNSGKSWIMYGKTALVHDFVIDNHLQILRTEIIRNFVAYEVAVSIKG